MSRPPDVTIDTCESEPIHIPGSIQPHGAMVILSPEGALLMASANAPRILGEPVDVGTRILPSWLAGTGQALLDRLGEGVHEAEQHFARKNGAGALIDWTAHWSDGCLVAEAEPRPSESRDPSDFAILAQNALDRLQDRTTTEELVAAAVREIRELSGFDRVMGYRFLADLAGEVIAEERRAGLESFLGLRYPAADIPSQARRLYRVNPVRAIADVPVEPSRLLPSDRHPSTGDPIDLSRSVLRSVSPIHVEYLGNMGVSASMSVSIVVSGRLWGLIACHHYSPRRLPPHVRSACRLLSRTLGLLVASAEEQIASTAVHEGERVARELGIALGEADDLIAGVAAAADRLTTLLDADAIAFTWAGRVFVHPPSASPELVRRIVGWLKEQPQRSLVQTDRLVDSVPLDEGERTKVSGILAVEVQDAHDSYVIWIRREEPETVRWAGNPDKQYGVGPNGPRLTPRGSFAEWRVSRTGASRSWRSVEIEIARLVQLELQRAALRHAAEMDTVRNLLLGTLGHDLRNPLNAISVAAELLRAGGESSGGSIGQRISRSTGRMQRLIDLMMDLSKIQSGAGLDVQPAETNLHDLVRALVDETELAFPGITIELVLSGDPMATIDADRMGQVLSNLLSNARHHGDMSKAIQISARSEGSTFAISVRNQGTPIPEELRAHIFEPFQGTHRQRGGWKGSGLGLYITREIVSLHRGQIEMVSDSRGTEFTVTFPR